MYALDLHVFQHDVWLSPAAMHTLVRVRIAQLSGLHLHRTLTQPDNATAQFVYNGHLAVDCLPYDTTEPSMAEIRGIITEQHLLQFGCLLGESSAELAIGMQVGLGV